MVRIPTRSPGQAIHRRASLPVAVWLFVMALLFGAVAPLGPPRTLVHGAAFNPATTSVALAQRGSQDVVAVWQNGEGGTRYDGAPGGDMVLPVSIALAPILALLFLFFAGRDGPAPHAIRCGARWARAPPAGRF